MLRTGTQYVGNNLNIYLNLGLSCKLSSSISTDPWRTEEGVGGEETEEGWKDLEENEIQSFALKSVGIEKSGLEVPGPKKHVDYQALRHALHFYLY